MKAVATMLVGLALCLSADVAHAQQEFPKPGAEHELLRQMAGEWNADVKCHNPEAGKGTEESQGSYTAKVDVGGYFLVTEFKAPIGGKPFQGRGVNGYDPFKKKYVGVWIDSMSPTIYATEGEFDKAGKTFKESLDGPGPDGKAMKMRLVTEIQDRDRMQFKMYGPGPDGKEMLMMEIAYTRKK